MSQNFVETIKPKKILPYEINLETAIEKVNKFFENSGFANKDFIVGELHQIYLPYWMYDCTCDIEQEEFLSYEHFFKTAKIECAGILANASSEMEDILTDKLEKFFDLSKLKDFDDDIYIK